MKITIIGTGNVATVLGRLLKKAGYEILQVYGRNLTKVEKLADELQSAACHEWSKIDTQAELYLIALSDRALYDLHKNLELRDRLVVHTAGSVPMHILSKVSRNYGVLYPLQTLRKELPVLTEIPLLVDGC